jgi:hypothetical protein
MQNDIDPLRMKELERKAQLFSRALDTFSEHYRGGELCGVLRDSLGMTNAEIESEGFDLQEHFVPDESSETEHGMTIKI